VITIDHAALWSSDVRIGLKKCYKH